MGQHPLVPLLAAMLIATCAAAGERFGTIVLQPPLEVATGGGERGPWQQNESRYDYVDDPTVVVGDNGGIAVAWVDQARKDVFFRRYSSDGIPLTSRPLNVSRTPATFSWLPRLAMAADSPGTIYILWQEIIFSGGSHGGDILFSRSIDDGKSFSLPINLSSSIGGDGKGRINRELWHNGSLDLAAGPNGTVYATWTEYAGTLWFSRSSDGGKHFSPPRRIAGSSNAPARAPSLACGPGSTLYLAWTVGENSAADIRIARSSDGGASFARPRVVAPGPGYSDAPKLAVDGRGIVHLAYGESSGGPFDRQHIRYTHSTDGGRSFSQPREISAPTPPATPGAGFPALAVDGRKGVYVIWELYPDHRKAPRGLGMVVSRDGGGQFTSPQEIPGSADPRGYNGSTQGLLMKKLSANRQGTVAIVNSSLKQGEGSRVWLMWGKPGPGKSGKKQ